MEVTGWKNGTGTFGIRVGKANVREHFPQEWKEIEIIVDGEVYRYPLSRTFWSTCPEIRGGGISAWLQEQGLAPWPKGDPPTLELKKVGERRFQIEAPGD